MYVSNIKIVTIEVLTPIDLLPLFSKILGTDAARLDLPLETNRFEELDTFLGDVGLVPQLE